MYTKDWAAKWALYSPQKVALRELDTDRALTYVELNQAANYLATELTQHHGLRKGDRVMVLAEHSLEYVVLFVAAQKTGLILVPINYRLAVAEIDYLVHNCQPALLIYEEQFQDKVIQLQALAAPTAPPVWPLQTLVDICQRGLDAEPVAFVAAELDEDDAVFILYTSGTTGFPKGALYTHRMLLWNSINTSQSLEITPDDVTINCMPPFHTGGWNVLLTPFLHRGATVGLLKKFQPERLLALLDQEQADIFMGVPTMLKMMMESPAFAAADLGSLRYFIVGGEALPLEVIRAWDRKGIKIRQGFGLTEVGPNLFSLHQDDSMRKIGSIGRSNFYVETKLIDEQGQEVGPDEVGELCLRGPMTTPGYWRDPEATAKAMPDGWFRTGDLLRRDAEGYFFVMDRIKNMYISGGENVYPAEIERFLLTFPGVSEVAVIGVPDERWGEVGKAFIVTKGLDISCEALQAYCAGNLARFKVPKYLELVPELPKNDTGKINKKALKASV
ncbi:long-chain fatty acid--CoA ligase [Hymenobacter sp. BT770]|uniref:class I adenylate-forming enzyme family protein n=1 Tax=Hymenobacter sp. BT770 TaxID=2886942 RepID=UPI001D12B427|nr:long-chain fatty acid--CoA ligase [Hymenobacter sp. BT770]MCC3155412.1 long-chain fatty acid--CoA ligase [Hymenobacter sp. BT770]MDO3417457.1 long-chain fatty acid--CoA ligase [Hymenobacter sp. BT770]